MLATEEIKLEKGSKVKWETKKLSEVCTILDNKRKPINSSEREGRITGKPESSLFPYYGATGQVGFIDDYLLDGEYVLLGEDGAPFLGSFKDKAYLVNGKIWVNNHAHILKANGSNKFLCYYLNQINYREYVSGTTRLKLNQSMMRDIPILSPPLPEQHRIVEKIEELFSELDSAITTLKTSQQQLQSYRQSVLKHAFEGYFTGGTKGWEQTSISEVGDKIQIGPFGSQLHQHDYIENGIPLINPMHIKNGKIVADYSYTISKEKRDSLPNYILEEGDVIMGRRGEMGRCALVSKNEDGWFCGTGSLFIRPDKKKVDSDFLLYFLSSRKIKEYLEQVGAGTTMTNLNLKIINSIPFHKPPISVQKSIIDEIETRLSESDYLLQTINEQLTYAERLRQSILQRAFSGEL